MGQSAFWKNTQMGDRLDDRWWGISFKELSVNLSRCLDFLSHHPQLFEDKVRPLRRGSRIQTKIVFRDLGEWMSPYRPHRISHKIWAGMIGSTHKLIGRVAATRFLRVYEEYNHSFESHYQGWAGFREWVKFYPRSDRINVSRGKPFGKIHRRQPRGPYALPTSQLAR
jgi:hypothetical protein